MGFAKAGLSVRSAHIATYAGQTLDTFYVTEFGGRLAVAGQGRADGGHGHRHLRRRRSRLARDRRCLTRRPGAASGTRPGVD